jgi:hypothetical protein
VALFVLDLRRRLLLLLTLPLLADNELLLPVYDECDTCEFIDD